VALYLNPEIKDNPLFIALSFVATVFPFLIMVWQIRKSDNPRQGPRKETKTDKVVDLLPGPHTNVTGGTQGDVFSGEFNGPTSSGGDAVDNRGSIGSINKPNCPVNQHFGNNINQIIQPQEKLPIPRIHVPPRDFVGRVDKLKEIMGNFNSGATIVGLWGMGGVGKTALALVLAEKLESRFPDGQIFIDLNGLSDNPLNSAEAMSKVILAVRGSEENVSRDQNDLKRLYNSILAGKRVMILLDNAGDRKQVEPLLPPKDCVVLITSRYKFSLPGMPEPFLLESLKPSDALDLLLNICPRMGGHAGEIAKLCGYLPLALRATASLLAVENDLTPSNYLDELRSERTRLKKIGKEGVDLDVEASFNLSYIRLPAETARVFRQLSVFPSDFDAQAEESVCQDESHEHLSELFRWNLVEYHEGVGRYRLHDLVRIFTAKKLQEDGTNASWNLQYMHAKYYRHILNLADHDAETQDGREQFYSEFSNIQAGESWARENLHINNLAADLCKTYYITDKNILDLQLHPEKRVLWLKGALEASRKLKDHMIEGTTIGRIGQAYANMGETRRAIQYYEQALAIAREIGSKRNEGVWLGCLGEAFAALGETRNAIEYLQQGLDITQEIVDKENEDAFLGSLGQALASLGEIRNAIQYYERALNGLNP
jgi:tetratricopeptide (TPR) repeat protein